MLVEQMRSFTDDYLIPRAAEMDKNHKFVPGHIKKCGEMGLLSVCVDPKYNGGGMDNLSFAIISEEINRGCASTGVLLGVNNSLYCSPIESFGTEEQKQKFLTPLTTGDLTGCFMLSEPGNGSDAGAASTNAIDKNDHW